MISNYASVFIMAGKGRFINTDQNCTKTDGCCGLLGQRTQRGRAHVCALTLRSLTWRPKIEPNKGRGQKSCSLQKVSASVPLGDREERFTDPRNPPWHRAWPALMQPQRPLDRGPSVARRAYQSPRTQTVPHDRGCWVCVSVQA